MALPIGQNPNEIMSKHDQLSLVQDYMHKNLSGNM